MKLLSLILFFAITFASCAKYTDVEPECLVDVIKDTRGSQHVESVKVDEYAFQEEMVYVVTTLPVIPDGGSEVYDSMCSVIGFLGGIAGNTKINDEEFSNAVFIQTVYED